jgi:hypothetical protein
MFYSRTTMRGDACLAASRPGGFPARRTALVLGIGIRGARQPVGFPLRVRVSARPERLAATTLKFWPWGGLAPERTHVDVTSMAVRSTTGCVAVCANSPLRRHQRRTSLGAPSKAKRRTPAELRVTDTLRRFLLTPFGFIPLPSSPCVATEPPGRSRIERRAVRLCQGAAPLTSTPSTPGAALFDSRTPLERSWRRGDFKATAGSRNGGGPESTALREERRPPKAPWVLGACVVGVSVVSSKHAKARASVGTSMNSTAAVDV